MNSKRRSDPTPVRSARVMAVRNEDSKISVVSCASSLITNAEQWSRETHPRRATR